MLDFAMVGASRAANESAGAPDEAGAVEVTIPIESIDDAAAKLMQLGTEAKVLDPAALRARLAEQGLRDHDFVRRTEERFVGLSSFARSRSNFCGSMGSRTRAPWQGMIVVGWSRASCWRAQAR